MEIARVSLKMILTTANTKMATNCTKTNKITMVGRVDKKR